MMKYKMKKEKGTNLFRIVSLMDFGDINKGQIGGLVENDQNLSQYGSCWIHTDAKVLNQSMVADSSVVRGGAVVSGKSKIVGESYINDGAIVQNALICGGSIIKDKSKIIGYYTSDRFGIRIERSRLTLGATAKGCDINIIGANIQKAAYITGNNQYITIGPIDGFQITFYKSKLNKIYVSTYFFNGTILDFQRKVENLFKDSIKQQYINACELAKSKLI